MLRLDRTCNCRRALHIFGLPVKLANLLGSTWKNQKRYLFGLARLAFGGPRRCLWDLLGFPMGCLWCSFRGWESHAGPRLACDSCCGFGGSSGLSLGVLRGSLPGSSGLPSVALGFLSLRWRLGGPSGDLQVSAGWLRPYSRLYVQPEAWLRILYLTHPCAYVYMSSNFFIYFKYIAVLFWFWNIVVNS